MNEKLDLIRDKLIGMQGSEVILHAIGERNKIIHKTGVLDGVYIDIFTVNVCEGEYFKRYCYTFKEIMSKNVVVKLSEPDQKSLDVSI